MSHAAILQLLQDQLFPALGCTEPAALAYAGALVRGEASGKINSIQLYVDKNFYKNCLRVTIPKTSLKGLDYAIALGIVGGNPEYRLEALQDIDTNHIREAQRLVSSGLIEVNIREGEGLYIEVSLQTEMGQARCRIEGHHSQITLLERNARQILVREKGRYEVSSLKPELSLDLILDFVRQVSVESLDFLEQGRQMNLNAAFMGLSTPAENYFGAAMFNWNEGGLAYEQVAGYAKALVAAACDARMSGKAQSVMAVAGSGNQGITATVPVAALSKALNISRESTLKAIALSYLTTYHIKSKIGLLSSVCGCAIAAGAGVSAAVVFLFGGTDQKIHFAVNNLIGGLAGMICDGAKGGCAFKISIATGAAFDAAALALKNICIQPEDGIVASDVEQTIDNLAFITNEGMNNLDNTLVKMMRVQVQSKEKPTGD